MSKTVNANDNDFEMVNHSDVHLSQMEIESPTPVEVVDLDGADDVNGGDVETGDEVVKRGKRSKAWGFFDEFVDKKDKIKKAKCKFCQRAIKAGDRKYGTNSLLNHIRICKNIKGEDKKQMKLNLTQFGKIDGAENRALWKHDDTKCRKALSYMIIMDELPFKTVEHLGFKYFISQLNPQFKIPSRTTLGLDCFKLYLEEKEKLKIFIQQSSQRVSITTDTWTSIQRVNYMCVTCHFIDNEWNLQKKILCFRPIKGHKGPELGQALERCLREWGIVKIFSITVDNASSNDGCVSHMKKKMDAWKTGVLGGTYVHMRCIAHIINLIVQDGLKEEHDSIASIRGFVRYVRSSPSRYQAFCKCVASENTKSKKLLSLDVPTRWNSTYLMLEAAVTHQSAFEAYEASDDNVRKDLEKMNIGVTTDAQWSRAKSFIKFLSYFYELTVSVSGSSYVTCNTVFHEISMVETLLNDWVGDESDTEFNNMAKNMKKKYDKYWGSSDKMNKLVYYAVILDPRCKMSFMVDYAFGKLYATDGAKHSTMKEAVKNGMEELFREYVKMYGHLEKLVNQASSVSSSAQPNNFERGPKRAKTYLWSDYHKEMNAFAGDEERSELQKYLAEDVERPKEGEKFDILHWWSKKAEWMPILSKMARDILGVPASTVASESAFSTGGRVPDPFRSSLLSKTVEALVCTQDWLRGSNAFETLEEDIQEIDTLEKEYEKMTIT